MPTAKVTTEDAEIVYDYEGAGPLLLTIAGRGGLGSRFAGISAILQDDYTVVRYDRRCCGRSTGDKTRPMDMTQQARDAIAILRALGEGQAYIFGNSAGASIGLRLAEYYPEAVIGMILHEPMTFTLLDDRDHWVEFDRKVDELYRAEGVSAAAKLLASSMVGMGGGGPPGGPNAPGSRAGEDIDFFFASEFMSLCYYWPDLDRIRRNESKLIATKGHLSDDAFYARTADLISQRVGCPIHTMSGNHIAYAVDPVTFAAELRPILAELQRSC